MNGRKLTLSDIARLLHRFSQYSKGIPVSRLGIKSWGVVDYALKTGMNIKLDYRS